jgi:hypothetical protein
VGAGLERHLGPAAALPQGQRARRHGALERERDAIHKKLVASEAGKLTPERLAALERQADLEYAKATVRRTEAFYRSIGFPELPASYYERSQFIKPADRDVVCHASAWDLDLEGDLRMKMCIHANEDDFRTVYHEMGHNYYYLSYEQLRSCSRAARTTASTRPSATPSRSRSRRATCTRSAWSTWPPRATRR